MEVGNGTDRSTYQQKRLTLLHSILRQKQRPESNFYDHRIQESFDIRKQICDVSTLDPLAICI